MKFKLFLTILTLTTIHQSFSMTPDEQLNINTQLLEAAKQGNNAAVASLLQSGADINAKDKYGKTSLHEAAMFGRTSMIELLLSKGADINAKDNKGLTPLDRPSFDGHTETVELLLSHGAETNADNVWTPLNFAMKIGQTAIVELLKGYLALLEQAKSPTKALLKVAIAHGYYGLVKLLLQRGLKPDATDLQLAKEKWQTAQYKKSYEAIGRLLIQKLSLVPKVEGIPAGGRISKSGIVGLYGLPESIAQNIATFCE